MGQIRALGEAREYGPGALQGKLYYDLVSFCDLYEHMYAAMWQFYSCYFFMYRALPVYGFYYISLGVVFIHWRMRMWWLTPAWGQTALTASIILMLMDEVVSWWWCYHVFVILYDDCDDDIKRYILFLELLEQYVILFFNSYDDCSSAKRRPSWQLEASSMVAKATWKWSLQRDVAYRIPGFPRSVGLLQRWSLCPSNGFCWVQESFYFPRLRTDPWILKLRFSSHFPAKGCKLT